MNSMYRNCKYSEEYVDPNNNSHLFFISLILQTNDKIRLRISSPKLIVNNKIN